MAESEKIRYVCSTKILLNTETISKVNYTASHTASDSFLLKILRRKKHAALQTAKQLQNTQSNLKGHLKVINLR